MLAYDIDGTLADTDFLNIYTKDQLINRYKRAKVLYKPTEDFIAITARGKDSEVMQATRTWIRENFNNCKGIYFVEGSEEEKITGKAKIVIEQRSDGYVDTNVNTLKLFKKYGITNIDLYHLILSTRTLKKYN